MLDLRLRILSYKNNATFDKSCSFSDMLGLLSNPEEIVQVLDMNARFPSSWRNNFGLWVVFDILMNDIYP